MNILIAGDFCPHGRVADLINSGDYSSVLSEVCEITAQSDYSIVNLECPIVNGDAKPIEKNGPNLSSSIKGLEAIKYAGFNCVSLANNHFLDYGTEGVINTLQSCKQLSIDTVGGGMTLSSASSVLYKQIGNQLLAIINCCEHEFSIATETSPGSNPLNPIKQYYAIKDARGKADHVLVIVHGGHEMFQLPSSRMVETYRFFVDAGADAVVNHHQHCYSGYEIYHGKLIFYGLGNFCFDHPTQRSGMWTEGYMVRIDFSDEKPLFNIYPYQQCANSATVKMFELDTFDEQLQALNSIIANSKLLEEKIHAYYASSISQYINIFEPLYNRFYMAAKSRGWLPSFVGKNRKLAAANYVACEAHRDKLLYWLGIE